MVDSQKLEISSLINAMESGDFYSSSGGILKKVYRDDKKISTKINDRVSILGEIQVFGVAEEKPLEEILISIFTAQKILLFIWKNSCRIRHMAIKRI